jgi:hypothetical protein
VTEGSFAKVELGALEDRGEIDGTDSRVWRAPFEFVAASAAVGMQETPIRLDCGMPRADFEMKARWRVRSSWQVVPSIVTLTTDSPRARFLISSSRLSSVGKFKVSAPPNLKVDVISSTNGLTAEVALQGTPVSSLQWIALTLSDEVLRLPVMYTKSAIVSEERKR